MGVHSKGLIVFSARELKDYLSAYGPLAWAVLGRPVGAGKRKPLFRNHSVKLGHYRPALVGNASCDRADTDSLSLDKPAKIG